MGTNKSIFKLSIYCIIIFFAFSCNTKSKTDIDDSKPLLTLGDTISDIDNNIYHTIKVGSQLWMIENLSVNRFINGDTIPEAKTKEEWERLGKESKPAWCYYNNEPDSGKKCGKLYNWYAVTDKRGLAPEGWQVPSDSNWTQLTDSLGGENVAGTIRKAIDEKNKKDTLRIGFSNVLGGYRYSNGNFRYIDSIGNWWSNTEINNNAAWYRGLYTKSVIIERNVNCNKQNGLSVRCFKVLKK
ncbi:MAG: fibrobacter succinogenes major paralogous domain-containing protein [Bacteroidota bacterium]